MAGIAAIQYGRDGFDTRSAEIVGRRVAGETFLRAWVRHSGADPITGWADTPANRAAFTDHVRELGGHGDILCANHENVAPLRAAGALWLADPQVGVHAWHRRWREQTAWSIVGITHTISTHAAMDNIANLLVAPVQRWDALICTSRAVKKVVETVLDAQASYLADRMGATSCTGPELPIIPLGVDCDAVRPDPAARARWRAELGLSDEDVAVLQFGRLSFHAKAHPLPLYLALRSAGERGGRKLQLILAGQFANPRQEEMYRRLAAAFSDSVPTHFVDGARPDAAGVRAAADIGTLLSDNIQESFGLAPVELMAAGLPVVGSDWDGLRDTIEHDVTGLLVPTTLPPPGAGEPIAQRYAAGLHDLNHYHQSVVQATAIDIARAADAFAALAADPERRRAMGAAARRRAERVYDWRHVIDAYRNLLAELAARRHAGTGERAAPRPGRPAAPARMDPFVAFGGFATARMTTATIFARSVGSPSSVAEIAGRLGDSILVAAALPSPATLDAMLRQIDRGAITLADLFRAFPDADQRLLAAGAAWLLKMGFVTEV